MEQVYGRWMRLRDELKNDFEIASDLVGYSSGKGIAKDSKAVPTKSVSPIPLGKDKKKARIWNSASMQAKLHEANSKCALNLKRIKENSIEYGSLTKKSKARFNQVHPTVYE